MLDWELRCLVLLRAPGILIPESRLGHLLRLGTHWVPLFIVTSPIGGGVPVLDSYTLPLWNPSARLISVSDSVGVVSTLCTEPFLPLCWRLIIQSLHPTVLRETSLSHYGFACFADRSYFAPSPSSSLSFCGVSVQLFSLPSLASKFCLLFSRGPLFVFA